MHFVVANVRWRNKYDAPTTAHVRLGIVRSNGKEWTLAGMDLWFRVPFRIISWCWTFLRQYLGRLVCESDNSACSSRLQYWCLCLVHVCGACLTIRLNLSAESAALVVFFSHNKLANSTFCHGIPCQPNPSEFHGASLYCSGMINLAMVIKFRFPAVEKKPKNPAKRNFSEPEPRLKNCAYVCSIYPPMLSFYDYSWTNNCPTYDF